MNRSSEILRNFSARRLCLVDGAGSMTSEILILLSASITGKFTMLFDDRILVTFQNSIVKTFQSDFYEIYIIK